MRRLALVGAALALLGVGLVVGLELGRPSGGSSGSGGPSSIDMASATGVTCTGPTPPGPGHASTVLSQLFNVVDSRHARFLLGWQFIPYHGLGTYHLGTAGNLLALEPPTGGRPVGFGTGTVTFSASPKNGTVNATVRLTGGGTESVTGSWVCAS